MKNLLTRALSRRDVLVALGISGVLPHVALRPALAQAAAIGPNRAVTFDAAALILATDTFWRSADGGSNWVETSDRSALSVTSLATHPDRPGRIFAGLKSGGVIRSDDGGATWSSSNAGLPALPITAVAAQSAETVLVAVEGDGLWQSIDAGESWSFVMDRPYLQDAETDVLAMTSVGQATGMGGIWIYSGTAQGLTRVPDCFCRWQDVQAGDAMDALAIGVAAAPQNPLPPGEAIVALASAYSAPQVLYAALASGLWKSLDAGVNWVQIHQFAALQIAVSATSPDRVIAANQDVILNSRDGGTSWSPLLNA